MYVICLWSGSYPEELTKHNPACMYNLGYRKATDKKIFCKVIKMMATLFRPCILKLLCNQVSKLLYWHFFCKPQLRTAQGSLVAHFHLQRLGKWGSLGNWYCHTESFNSDSLFWTWPQVRTGAVPTGTCPLPCDLGSAELSSYWLSLHTTSVIKLSSFLVLWFWVPDQEGKQNSSSFHICRAARNWALLLNFQLKAACVPRFFLTNICLLASSPAVQLAPSSRTQSLSNFSKCFLTLWGKYMLKTWFYLFCNMKCCGCCCLRRTHRLHAVLGSGFCISARPQKYQIHLMLED